MSPDQVDFGQRPYLVLTFPVGFENPFSALQVLDPFRRSSFKALRASTGYPCLFHLDPQASTQDPQSSSSIRFGTLYVA